jgi:hypothetical protein
MGLVAQAVTAFSIRVGRHSERSEESPYLPSGLPEIFRSTGEMRGFFGCASE